MKEISGDFAYTKDEHPNMFVKNVEKTSFNPKAMPAPAQKSCFSTYAQLIKAEQKIAKHYDAKTFIE